MKSKLYPYLRASVSIILLGLLFYIKRDSLALTIKTIEGLRPALFVSSCAIFAGAIALMSTRLKLVLNAQGIYIKYVDVLYLTYIGYFFNNFLPTAIGGDIVKAYYAYKKTGAKLKSFVSVFMDRFLGVFSLFMLAGASLIFSHRYVEDKVIIWLTLAILFALLLLLLFFTSKRFSKTLTPLGRILDLFRIRKKAREVLMIVNLFKDQKYRIARAIAVSLTAQAICFSVLYFLSRGMGAFISLKMVLLFMPLVSIISMLPSINGLGIREGAIYFLFGPYVGYENAFALSLLWLFMLLLVGIIGGIAYFLRRNLS